VAGEKEGDLGFLRFEHGLMPPAATPPGSGSLSMQISSPPAGEILVSVEEVSSLGNEAVFLGMVSGKADQGSGDGLQSQTSATKDCLESHEEVTAEGDKKSWLNAATGRIFPKQKFEVSEVDGHQRVVVPKEVFVDAKPLWEDFLIGKFVNAKAPHVGKIHMIVNKIWRLGDKSTLIDVFVVNDTTVKFRVRNEAMRRRILNRGMWNIMNVPMLISKWSPFAEEAQPVMKSIPLWITLKNVPPSMFTDKGLDFLASAVGKPIRLHPKTEACESFEVAQILVEADLTKDLLHEYNLRGEEEGELDVTINYSYPWLPPRCSCCKKWGHGTEACLATVNDSQKVPESTSSQLKSTPISEQIPVSNNGGETDKLEKYGNADEDESKKDGGWITPPKTGRSPAKKINSLKFGEVSILSNSYSALSGKGEGGGENVESETNAIKEGEESLVAETQEPEELQQVNSNIVNKENTSNTGDIQMRQSLPRGSKDAHKFVSNTSSTQTARIIPRNARKKSQKNH